MHIIAGPAAPIEAFGDITPIDDADLFDADGTLKAMPAAFWEATTLGQRVLFGHEHGIYSFPTLEGVEFIRQAIAGRENQTIEIGAGMGQWSKALGIRATDSYLQRRPDIAKQYADAGQKPAPYGTHVRKYEAMKAVREFRPKVVVASWCTQKFRADRFCMRGNVDGVDELRLLTYVDEYIFIGSTASHGDKMILEDLATGALSHRCEGMMSTHVYSRAQQGKDFIIHLVRK
ncbi:hypothetical protein AH156_19865 [Salmonella enterica subsp. enterica serovar Enteritidis]|nr:hypothetical protein [Salmonella enterica subsp. enterica serovar Enteritidis]